LELYSMTSRNPQPAANGEFNDESLHQLFQPRTQAVASQSLGNGALAKSSNGHPKDAIAEPPAIRAKKIEMSVTPACLASSAGSKSWSVEDWYYYCEQILADLGTTGDPLERMMIEEFILGHQNINRMFVAAANPQCPEQAECLYAAIPRLLAELRRMALAIREYRSPVVSKIVNVVGQQNVAQNQQIAHLTTKAPSGAADKPNGKKVLDTKMVSNAPKALTHEAQQQFSAKSETHRGREIEPAKARRTISGDPAASAGRRPKKPSVALDHRAKDRSR
jgi:hypothetical protein